MSIFKLQISNKISDAAICRLGESLNQLLTGLEDMNGIGTAAGVRIPRAMERDLRHAMDLESPFQSPMTKRRALQTGFEAAKDRQQQHLLDRRAIQTGFEAAKDRYDVNRLTDLDYENDGDDEVSLEEELSFPFSPEDCGQVAQLLSFGLLSQDDAGKIDFFHKNDEDDDDDGDDVDDFEGQHEDIFQEMEHLFDLEEGELNIPWLLAKTTAKIRAEMAPGTSGSAPGNSGSAPGASGLSAFASGYSGMTAWASEMNKSAAASSCLNLAPGSSGLAPGSSGLIPGASGSANLASGYSGMTAWASEMNKSAATSPSLNLAPGTSGMAPSSSGLAPGSGLGSSGFAAKMTAWACGRTDSEMSAWASEMSSLMTGAPGTSGLSGLSGLAACGTYAAMPEQLRAAFEEEEEEMMKKHFEKFEFHFFRVFSLSLSLDCISFAFFSE